MNINFMCDFPDCECVGPERCEKLFVDATLKKVGEEELKKVLAEDEEAPTE